MTNRWNYQHPRKAVPEAGARGFFHALVPCARFDLNGVIDFPKEAPPAPSTLPLVRSSRKQVVLGLYPTEIQAALAYDDAARAAQIARDDAAAAAAAAGIAAPPTPPPSGSGSPATPAAGTASAATSGAVANEAPLPLNFQDDEEAQQRLDEVAIFEVSSVSKWGVDGEAELLENWGAAVCVRTWWWWSEEMHRGME